MWWPQWRWAWLGDRYADDNLARQPLLLLLL